MDRTVDSMTTTHDDPANGHVGSALSFAGVLHSGKSDLATRSEQILRSELGRTWAGEEADISRCDDLEDFVDEQSSDPEFAAAHNDAQARAELLAACVGLRKQSGLTQADVARSMGSTQSAVSDLEAGATDPRLTTLQRYTRAIGVRLEVALHHPTIV